MKFIANIVLVAPEIPHNTGNIIRLCANVGARLHLVKPIGFSLDNSNLQRAALDYTDLTNMIVHDSTEDFLDSASIDRVFAAVTNSSVRYTIPQYQLGDTIIFGSESVGLSHQVTSKIPDINRIQIPMMPSNRSINLSNAVAVVAYEMWRQIGFLGANTQK